MLLNYLFYAGLPLMALRTAVRSNDTNTINNMWVHMLRLFRATGKVLYAKLCVHVIHTYFRMKPELQTILDTNRTASLRGHNGRNVGWDFTLERMNPEVQTMLGNNVSAERIPEVIRQLNGIRRVRGQTLDAFGLGEDALRESSDIKQTDVDTLVGHLKKALKLDGNDDASKCFTPNSNQPFRRGSGTPWGDIRKEEQKKSTKDYVEEKLRGCPGNNMPSVQI